MPSVGRPYIQLKTQFHSAFSFFNDTATTEIYTLSLHDALPISLHGVYQPRAIDEICGAFLQRHQELEQLFRGDRKSTRLNSSHGYISYAVFCLKKKKKSVALRRHQTRGPRLEG